MERPGGLSYQEGFVSPEEERALVATFEEFSFSEVRMRGQAARRTVLQLRLSLRTTKGGSWSPAGSVHPRFQRGKEDERRIYALELAPRSIYILAGAARSSWQHSIPTTKDLRYSVTVRTVLSRQSLVLRVFDAPGGETRQNRGQAGPLA